METVFWWLKCNVITVLNKSEAECEAAFLFLVALLLEQMSF